MIRTSSLFQRIQDFHVWKGGFPETRRKHQRKLQGQKLAKDCVVAVAKAEEPCDKILVQALQASKTSHEVEQRSQWEHAEVLHMLKRAKYAVFDPPGDGHCGPNALNFVTSSRFTAQNVRNLVCNHVLQLTDAELNCVTQGVLGTHDAAVKWARKFCSFSNLGVHVCREFLLLYAHMMAFRTGKAGVAFLCKPESGKDGEFDVHFNSKPTWVDQALPSCSLEQLNSLAAGHLILLFTGNHFIGVRPMSTLARCPSSGGSCFLAQTHGVC